MNVFKLPDLGEGLPDAEIAAWHVKVGDSIKVDEPLVAMETAKAIVEIPSPQTGVVAKLHGKPGDIIETGAPLVEFIVDSEELESSNYGIAGKLQISNEILVEKPIANSHTKVIPDNSHTKVTPAIRALAKQLGVELEQVTPTGKNGNITALDVHNAINKHTGGDELRSTLNKSTLIGARRSMAQAMQHAHNQVAAVTVVDDAVLLNWKEGTDISVRIIQAIISALQQEPALNAWFDSTALSKEVLSVINLGIACDSGDALIVPVIKDIARLSSVEIRQELENIKIAVQNRTVRAEQLRNATFTLSNFGKFGGKYANPIVVPPQVAILGTGAVRFQVVAVDGNMRIAKVMPLSLTFDHRACTGGEATRFLAAVIRFLVS